MTGAAGTVPAILAVGEDAALALAFPDVQLSFAELRAASAGWAGRLAGLGVGKGDVVGVLLPTCPEFLELLFAIASIGAVMVPINPRYRAHELAHVLADAAPVVLVTTDAVADHVDFVARVQDALPSGRIEGGFACDEAPSLRHIVVIGGDGRWATTDAAGLVPAALPDAAPAPDDLAIILYTSGTSSNPKGCLITHRALTGSARNYARHYGVGPTDSFWCPLPINHIAGIVPALTILSVGAPFLTLRRFDAGDALAQVAAMRPTCGLPSYATIIRDLMDHPDFARTDWSCFRWTNTSPSVQAPALREAWAAAMPGVAQVGTYGMTEAVGPATGHHPGDAQHWCDKGLGGPFHGWEFRIVDPDTGEEAGAGQSGEIWLRGETLASGYYRRSEPIADADGWFHTGDLGSVEDGQLVFQGRLKDMLKVGGENVAAVEVESVLDGHPGVRMSQVIGVPHPRYVEIPIAFVQAAADPAPTKEELIALCRARLAAFKVPRDVVFVDEWPMSTTKIQKFRLKERYLAAPSGDLPA